MKESNKGKPCIKIAYAFCTPKLCGLLNCEHAEDVEQFRKEVDEHNEAMLKRNACYPNLSSKQTIIEEG